MTPTWLVTGAEGFLGANAGWFLGPRAHAVGITRRPNTPAHFAAALHGDLTEPADIAAKVRNVKPAVILHAGAMASHEMCEANPQLAKEVNADATRELARAAHDCGAAFIYISTDAVFDGTRGGYSEEDKPNPFSVYGATKLLGEQYALQEHPDALIIRTNFFGWSPTGSRSILEFFVNSMASGTRVNGYTDFTVTSTYAQSLMGAVWALTEQGATGIVHVASSDAVSKFDFGCIVAATFGLDAGLINAEQAEADGHRTDRRRDLSLRVARLEELLGEPAPTQLMGILRAYEDSGTVRTSLRKSGGST